MPELPEVETVRHMLSQRILGRTIIGFKLLRPNFYRKVPAQALQKLLGTKVEQVRRRGKYLLLELSGGKSFWLHLGMSGRLSLALASQDAWAGESGAHVRFEILLDGHKLSFHDPRRFGRVGCVLPELGPEPLDTDFHENYLWEALRGRRSKIKAALMDQSVIAGLGNIYATEALFAAGLRPGRRTDRLSRSEVTRLVRAIRQVLSKAVQLGGSTLDDEAFLNPLGEPGYAQQNLAVYGRDMGRCGHKLKTTLKPISGRTSIYCPVCQK